MWELQKPLFSGSGLKWRVLSDCKYHCSTQPIPTEGHIPTTHDEKWWSAFRGWLHIITHISVSQKIHQTLLSDTHQFTKLDNIWWIFMSHWSFDLSMCFLFRAVFIWKDHTELFIWMASSLFQKTVKRINITIV